MDSITVFAAIGGVSGVIGGITGLRAMSIAKGAAAAAAEARTQDLAREVIELAGNVLSEHKRALDLQPKLLLAIQSAFAVMGRSGGGAVDNAIRGVNDELAGSREAVQYADACLESFSALRRASGDELDLRLSRLSRDQATLRAIRKGMESERARFDRERHQALATRSPR